MRQVALKHRAGLGVALLLAALWLGATSGIRPLVLPDEGRYAGVAWEMLASGRWAVPMLDGLPFFHKPPLFYWITASAFGVFGPHEWAARIASLLGALLMVVSVCAFAARRLDAGAARWSAVALVTMPYLYVASQFANLDMLVAGCIAASTLAFADAALAIDDARAFARSRIAGYLFAALGVLAKGLIGVVIPVAVIALWLLSLRRSRTLARLALGIGPLLFVAIAAPWFVAMQLRYPGFFDYFVLTQHLRRFVGGGFNNPQPWWFYPPVIAVLTLPWSALWPFAAWRAQPAESTATAAVRRLAWIWLLVVLVFFSIPRSKLIGYVLPALAPLALLIGASLAQRLAGGGRWPVVARATAGVAAALCIGGLAAAAVYGERRTSLPLARVLQQQAGPDDALMFVEMHPYDLAFLLRRSGGIAVVTDWSDPQNSRRDDWRQELHDAARFDPERGRAVLVDGAAMSASLCSRAVTWIVAPEGVAAQYPVLAAARPLAATRDASLWRIERSALDASGSCKSSQP